MRTIGLLGGMSWQSSLEYYRIANELVAARLGGLHSARLVLTSVDFAEIGALQRAGKWDVAGQLLAGEARGLVAAGADMVLICTNTMHKVADEVAAEISVPLVHLADTTAEAVKAAGLRKVALLGTAFTMEQDFYRDRLAAHGLEVIVPEAVDRAVVHQVIFDELCVGTIRDASRQAYRAIIQKLVAQGAQGVILGCTEIELLISQADSSVPVFPTTRLHITAAVDLALDDQMDGQRDDQQYGEASSGLCPPNVVSSAPELVSSRP